MRIRAFITPHKSEKIYECQDRFSINQSKRIAAVSDGVSQSIFPDYWAKLLVDHYVTWGQPTEEDRITLCKEWKDMVLAFINKERSSGRNPWRTESNLYEGISAGATLCGLSFYDDYSWKCDVIGDSCLISSKIGEPISIYSSEEKKFDTYPDYLDSNSQKKGRGSFKSFSGVLNDGDCLLLVSDPFSDYFQELGESCNKQIDALRAVNSHESFIQLVEEWRESGMHNDDSTAVIIEYDGSPDFNFDVIDDIEQLIQAEIANETEENITDSFEASVSGFEEKDKAEDAGSPDIADNKEPLETLELEPKIVYVEKDLSSYRQTMIEAIPAFTERFIGDLIKPKSPIIFSGVSSIIRFFFQGKKKRVQALTNLINTAANCYVEQLTNKNV